MMTFVCTDVCMQPIDHQSCDGQCRAEMRDEECPMKTSRVTTE